VSKRLGSPYRSGRSAHWVKVRNPKAPAVKREAEEDWRRWQRTNSENSQAEGEIRLRKDQVKHAEAIPISDNRFAGTLRTDTALRARACTRAREKSLKNFGLVPLRCRHGQRCRALAGPIAWLCVRRWSSVSIRF
jgi:hypothetical protein